MKMFSRVVIMLISSALLVVLALPASAHEGRELGGDITVYFGWRVEPAVTNVLNGPEIFIEPENLTADLQVEITFGPESITLTLVPAWEDPGHYIADLIPTMPGDYSFRVFGMIGDTAIDEVFTSADGEFSTVEPAMDIMFPQAGIIDSAALLERIDALEARIAALESADPSSVRKTMISGGCGLPLSEIMKRISLAFALFLFFWAASVLYAHANLAQAQPVANSVLQETPPEIRLWFTEPLEPQFSRITLYDSRGTPVSGLSSRVDSGDPTQMFMLLSALDDGVYTVAWRVLSATDGHSTRGSYSFTLGEALTMADGAGNSATITTDTAGVLVRAFNLITLALLFGVLCFYLRVWAPSGVSNPHVEKWLRRWFWITWLVVGIGSAIMLVYQVNNAGGQASDLLLTTRFGALWLMRSVLWLLLGIALVYAANRRVILIGVVLASGILLTNSLFSHAVALDNSTVFIFSDWLHFIAAGLWFGGLAAFLLTLLVLRRTESAGTIGQLTGRFSNLARIAVLLLILTGTVAAVMQVSSLTALAFTAYGQALILKIVLFIPVLVLAGINLLITGRYLRMGQGVWVGRLRWLMCGEIALLFAVLTVTGFLTSTNPAREALIEQSSDASAINEASPLYLAYNTDTLHMHMEITPGLVGENTLRLHIYDLMTGESITDATRVRMRFENEDANLGFSELRAELQPDGSYAATGSNLSISGNWRLRLTIARPGEFDTVVDFELEL